MVGIILTATLAAPISFAPPGSDQPVQTVGTAEAGAVEDAQTAFDHFKSAAYFIGVAPWADFMTSDDYELENDTQEKLNETDTIEHKTNVHANTRIVQTKNEETFAVVDNYNNDSRNIAWVKAKKAIIEELNTGGTESSAKTRAKEAIRDYYAQKQLNLIEQWNSTVNAYQYNEGIDQDAITDTDFVHLNYTHSESGSHVQFKVIDKFTNETTVQLVNNTDAPIRSIGVEWVGTKVDNPNYHETVHYHLADYTTTDYDMEGSTINSAELHSLVTEAPTTDYDTVRWGDPGEFNERWTAFVTQKDQMVANVDPFVNSTYSEYMADQINTSDIQDPYTLASEYTSEYNDTGYYAYAVANNALLGVDTPTLESTSLMNVSVNGVNYNGMVMGNLSDYNDTLSVGQTYSFPSAMTIQLATTNGDIIDLSGHDVTLNRVENKDGETVQNVTYRTYNYQTADSSQLQEQLNQLNELQAEIEDLEQQLMAQGSSGGFPDLGSMGPAGLGVVLIGAAVLLGKD